MTRVLRSDSLTRGNETRAFEEEFAGYVGAGYAVACSSGTAALWLAVHAAQGSQWQRWMVPAITFAATRNAARDFGPTHWICDVNPKTGLLADYPAAEVSQRGIPVLYAGQAISESFAVNVYDACHALGSLYPNEDRVGSHNNPATCFSFHPSKTITTGEGGMVVTDDEGYAGELRRFRDNGIVRPMLPDVEPWWYDNSGYGLNFHMSDIAAALGRSQLKRIDETLERRRALAREYRRCLPGLAKPVIQSVDRNACHIFPVLIDFDGLGVTRAGVMQRLLSYWKIATQVHYIPLASLPGANEFYRRELTLPLHCEMNEHDVRDVCDALAASCIAYDPGAASA